MSKLTFKPSLRFPEFNTGWVKTKLGNVCNIGTGNRDTKDADDNGIYPFFVRSDNVKRIGSYTKDCEAILTSGDGVGVGKNFHYIVGKFDFHQRVYCLDNFKAGFNGRFIYQYFKEKFYKRVQRLSAKNSVDSVRFSMISHMEISFPSEEEQKKIADFLSAVDEKIRLLKEKHALLQQYKQGVMQKLFSQEIRFKDDNGQAFPDWTEKRFEKCFERVSRKNKINNLNVLTISAQHGLINQEKYFNKSVSAADVTGYYLLNKGEFAYNKSYSKGYPMGAIKRLNNYDQGVVSTLYICFKSINNQCDAFWEQFFEGGMLNRQISKIAQEGARNHGLLNVSVTEFFHDMKVTVPCVDEQKKIAEFLQTLDKKLDAVQQQIDLTQTFKKGLLQQMFV